MQSPIEAEPLPQGIPLKAHIKSLRREIHQTKKKLKKTEDELQRFKKCYTDASIKINHLRQSSKQFFMDHTVKKYHLIEELEWA